MTSSALPTPRMLSVELIKAHPSAQLTAGTLIGPVSLPAVLGRSPSALIFLNEPTVAREHLRFELKQGALQVTSLTQRGSTYVAGHALRAHASHTVELAQQPFYVQVGRLLLRVGLDEATLPFEEVFSLPDADTPSPRPAGAWLRLHGPAPICVMMGTHQSSVFPSAARVLRALAMAPSQVVPREELELAMQYDSTPSAGGNNLTQAITYLRNMFEEACKLERLERELRARVAACQVMPGVDNIHTLSQRMLLRALIENVRGVGYRLRLDPQDVTLVWEGEL